MKITESEMFPSDKKIAGGMYAPGLSSPLQVSYFFFFFAAFFVAFFAAFAILFTPFLKEETIEDSYPLPIP